MEITIKSYSKEYAEQCADLEKYLWKGTFEERLARFHWTYTDCPNFSQPLSVIAVNENDEVIGFRGYFINSFKFNEKKLSIAQLSDTVVSEKARRIGIFQRMTNYSLKILCDNRIPLILNLSASWPPYHGYKKISFEDLAPFHSRYKFYLSSLINQKLLKKKREGWNNITELKNTTGGISYTITQHVSDNILKQVGKLDDRSGIHSSLDFENLKWRTQRPGRNYIYLYAVDGQNKLQSFVMLRTSDFYQYDMGLVLSDNNKILKKLMKQFYSLYKPSVIAAWDFATDNKRVKQLKSLNMISIPFINKIRKNPPALLRTLQTIANGELNWNIEGMDIRKVSNWSINKLDLDSF